MDNIEIERKYLVDADKVEEILSMNKHTKKEIEQIYISLHPECELRIRNTNNESYVLVYKSNLIPDEYKEFDSNRTKALINKEVSIPLTKTAYSEIKGRIQGSPSVSKTRYDIPWENGLKIELDVFKGALSGLAVAEIEFTSLEESYLLNIPDWFGEEVTSNEYYKNRNLAKLGVKVIRRY